MLWFNRAKNDLDTNPTFALKREKEEVEEGEGRGRRGEGERKKGGEKEEKGRGKRNSEEHSLKIHILCRNYLSLILKKKKQPFAVSTCIRL